MPVFFVEKNVRGFCIAKACLTFSTKNISVFGYKVTKQLKVGSCPNDDNFVQIFFVLFCVVFK